MGRWNMNAHQPAGVDHYYNRNTRRFLRFAARGSSSTIHRAVWAPGVLNRRDAVHYVHRLILQYALADLDCPVVWDLGCGVGASIAYLAAERRGSYRGVTISGTQRSLAERLLSQRLRCATADWSVLHGDFCRANTFQQLMALSPARRPALVYMIEAFGHAADPRFLLRSIAESLDDQGTLVICDDIIAHAHGRRSAEARQFAAGWQIASLWTVDEISACAADYGMALEHNIDLTPWVEINRPRDRIIASLITALDCSRVLRRRLFDSPFWANMRGGSALQRALANGTMRYRVLVYRKQDAVPDPSQTIPSGAPTQ
ncbi:MAG: class I SAM-dependent methyltransferase [Spirochaetaceae bacterium]|nr:MAG: class I SAM-dependent methyltransferase [Spirochaetaceae bacterium]